MPGGQVPQVSDKGFIIVEEEGSVLRKLAFFLLSLTAPRPALLWYN